MLSGAAGVDSVLHGELLSLQLLLSRKQGLSWIEVLSKLGKRIGAS
jgi:hypothetical protein